MCNDCRVPLCLLCYHEFHEVENVENLREHANGVTDENGYCTCYIST